MAEFAGTPRTLEAAVRAEVARGTRDPVEIVARLSERHGQTWLLRQLVNVVARVVAGGAAIAPASPVLEVGSARSERAARTATAQHTKPGVPRVRKAAGNVPDDFFASSHWVSAEVGWRRIVDLTASDCRTIAAQYALLADAAGQRGRWFEGAAAAIDTEDAATLGDLRRQLVAPAGEAPALPAADAKL